MVSEIYDAVCKDKHLVRAGESRARQTLMVGEGREGGRDQLAERLVNHIMEHELTLELSILILCWVMKTDESCLYSLNKCTSTQNSA